MSQRGAKLQRVNAGAIPVTAPVTLLSTSPTCTIDVGSFVSCRVFVEFTYGAATSVDMAVQAILVGASTEYVDLTATYTEAVSADKNFYWDVPVNCTQLKLTFTGGGTPTTDVVVVHTSVID